MPHQAGQQFFPHAAACLPARLKTALRLLLLSLCLIPALSHAADKVIYRVPPHTADDDLTTNWWAQARAALPAGFVESKNPNFPAVTNALCREARHGNNTAAGLWGMVQVANSRTVKDVASGFDLLRKSAAGGYAPAMTQLGFLYENDRYVRKNFTEAFHWLTLGADQGDADALLELGGCYQYGLGTTPDAAKAADCYRRSAELTNYVAMKSYGYCLMDGVGVNRDLGAAKTWLLRAATEGGNRRAMNNLAVLYALKYPDTNAMAESFRWFKQGAELGDALACYQLSLFYLRGWGVVETNAGSFRYWRFRAAAAGQTEAQYEMGVAYRTGDGVPVNNDLSLVWYSKAAAKNHPRAIFDLALHYFAGQTNHDSLVKADALMLRAAKLGHREAQFQYAMNSFRGDIAPVNFVAGREWLMQSANAGWWRTEFFLFELYYYGKPPAPGCPAYGIDKTEAIQWLRRAADHGELHAQSILGVMLLHGLDLPPDKKEGERLLRAAALHGSPEAQNDLGYSILHGEAGTKDLVESALWLTLAKHAANPSVAQRAEANLANASAQLDTAQMLDLNQRLEKIQLLPPPELDPLPAGWENNGGYQQEDGQFGH